MPTQNISIDTNTNTNTKTSIDTNIDIDIDTKTSIDTNIDIDTKNLPIINKNNIEKVILFCLLFITILLQIIIKIWTFIILINYYNKLNEKISSDDTVIYDDYKYIYYLAVTNLVFTIITIIFSLISFYIYIYKYSIFKQYKKKIELIISIMWIISTILSITSTLIRSKIKDKYDKYLSHDCDINELVLKILLIISFVFFCLSLIIQYIIPFSIKLYNLYNLHNI
jgi:hypothetical protein